MEPTSRPVETLSNRHPDAKNVGEHLVINKTQWCPGPHPDPHRRQPDQTEYLERYLRCIQCGVEVLQRRDLPESCDSARWDR